MKRTGGRDSKRAALKPAGTISLARKIVYSIIPVALGMVVVLAVSNYMAAKRQILSGVDREIGILAGQA
ncbi:MAG: hypothetical protein ABII00_12465, partial [Elusimicrobiota bacterium]